MSNFEIDKKESAVFINHGCIDITATKISDINCERNEQNITKNPQQRSLHAMKAEAAEMQHQQLFIV